MNTIASKVPTAVRIVLGLVFTVFGLNGFLHFLPQPPMSGPPAEFFGLLVASGYMLPVAMGTQLGAGLLLLSGRFVPLALALLAPVIVNILGFHVFVAKGGLAVPLIVLTAEVFLAWAYRDAFRPMLSAHVEPRVTQASGTHAAAI